MKFEIYRAHKIDAARGGKDIKISVYRTKYDGVHLPMMNDEEFLKFREAVEEAYKELIQRPTSSQSDVDCVMPVFKFGKNSVTVWSCMSCSALVRFLYNDTLMTAAITHATSKAFRIFNLQLGAAWIPVHILGWSEFTQEYVILDEEYQPNFTKNVTDELNFFPKKMVPEAIKGVPEIAEVLHPMTQAPTYNVTQN